MDRKEVILPILFAITISLGFSYHDAAAAIVLYSDPLAGGLIGLSWSVNIVADDFVLTSDETVTDIHFFISSSVPWDENVIYTIYADNAGEPGLIIDSGTLVNVVTQLDDLGVGANFSFIVDGDLPAPLDLVAGTYWLSLETPSPHPSTIILDNTPVGAEALFSTDGGVTWNIASAGSGVPFDITGLDVLVGGHLISIDTTALLVAGAYTMTPWLILGILSAVGIGLAVFTLKRSR